MKKNILFIFILFLSKNINTKNFIKKIKNKILYQKKKLENKIDYLNFLKKENILIFEKEILKIFDFVKPGTEITKKIIDKYMIVFDKEIKEYFNKNKIKFILTEDEIKNLLDYLKKNFLNNLNLKNPQILSYFTILLANIYKKNRKIKEICDFINLLESDIDFKNKNFKIFKNLKDEITLKNIFYKIVLTTIKEKNKKIDLNLLYYLSEKFSDSLIKKSKKFNFKKSDKKKRFCEIEHFEKKLKNNKDPVLIEKISKISKNSKEYKVKYFLFFNEKIFEILLESKKENFKVYKNLKEIINKNTEEISIFNFSDEFISLTDK